MASASRVLACLVGALVAAPAGALIAFQNRLSNPDFDQGIVGWSPSSHVTWASDVDADDAASSGALRIAVDGEVGAVQNTAACLRIVGGEQYAFGGFYFIPPGQVPSGEATIIADWYDQPDCTGYMDSDGIPSSQDHGVVGEWMSLAGNGTPPANADSLRLVLGGWKLVGQENQPDFVIYFDSAVVVPEAAGALAASAAVGALVMLRPRSAGSRRAPSRSSDRRVSAAPGGR